MTDVTSNSGQVPLEAPLRGASFGQAFARFFKKYAIFHGRASRSEFWWWFLANWVISGVLYGLVYTVGNPMMTNENGVPTPVFSAILIPVLPLEPRDVHPVARALVAPPARHEPVGRVVVHRLDPGRRLDHPARLLRAAAQPGRDPLRSVGGPRDARCERRMPRGHDRPRGIRSRGGRGRR